jgi:hypothetical protein
VQIKRPPIWRPCHYWRRGGFLSLRASRAHALWRRFAIRSCPETCPHNVLLVVPPENCNVVTRFDFVVPNWFARSAPNQVPDHTATIWRVDVAVVDQQLSNQSDEPQRTLRDVRAIRKSDARIEFNSWDTVSGHLSRLFRRSCKRLPCAPMMGSSVRMRI